MKISALPNMRSAMAERTRIRCCGETRRSRDGISQPSAPTAIQIGLSLAARRRTSALSRIVPIQRSG